MTAATVSADVMKKFPDLQAGTPGDVLAIDALAINTIRTLSMDAVQAAIGRWGNFAKQAGVPKEISAEARSWHRRIRERVCGH